MKQCEYTLFGCVRVRARLCYITFVQTEVLNTVWIAMQFCQDVHEPQRTKSADFFKVDDPAALENDNCAGGNKQRHMRHARHPLCTDRKMGPIVSLVSLTSLFL